jgi:hypothetical protein
MKITDLKKPLAITMWDSSWIRRRYAGGGFENYSEVVGELVERGYNAVRIDAFPHLIAKDIYGQARESFFDPPGISWQKYAFAIWGNQWTTNIYPRRDLIEFMRACQEKDVYVGLSTWLKPTIEVTNEQIYGAEGVVRIWDETLKFLEENDCLKNVLYVDVLNEFPGGTCFPWLNNNLNNMKHPKMEGRQCNKEQIKFLQSFIDTVIAKFKALWPELSFAASINYFKDLHPYLDYSSFDFLDFHRWAYMDDAFARKFLDVGYNEILSFGDPAHFYVDTAEQGAYNGGGRLLPGDINFGLINDRIRKAWEENRESAIEWLESEVSYAASLGRELGIPVGCTEGWGPLLWFEHPLLDWDVVKDAGEIGARLGAKYGYAFNCQSNECEPQFIRLWRDIDYHKKVTDIIKRGKIG